MSFILKNEIKSYAWGKKGGINKIFGIKPQGAEAPVQAELWMGSHNLAPSRALGGQVGGLTLSEALNKINCSKQTKDFDFLFKVLSADKPLSIQVHPGEKRAEYGFLHGLKGYVDKNEKTEMLYVLSEEFKLLWGIRTLRHAQSNLLEIKSFLEKSGKNYEIQPVCDLIKILDNQSEDSLEYFRDLLARENIETLRKFSLLLSDIVLCSLDKDKGAGAANSVFFERYDLILRLAEHYQGDIGIALSFFMNYLTLKKGQSLLTKSGIAHSYIKGDCLEIITNSDNVFRSALTDKDINIDEFLENIDLSFQNNLSYKNIGLNHIRKTYKNNNIKIVEICDAISGLDMHIAQCDISSIAHNGVYRPQDGSILLLLQGCLDIVDKSGMVYNMTSGSFERNSAYLLNVEKIIVDAEKCVQNGCEQAVFAFVSRI